LKIQFFSVRPELVEGFYNLSFRMRKKAGTLRQAQGERKKADA
jgi:hypothetical protein